MSTAAILSIKPVYANQIMAGTKKVELRKSAMGLNAGDVVLVYNSAPEQQIAFWFQIASVEACSVDEMWARHQASLGIDYQDYLAYFSVIPTAVGLHVGEVQPVSPIALARIEELVPGFVPPQGLIWLRDDIGRFERLLATLSTPLPAHVFAQQTLMF
jgi:predicted transcriptional regulator